MFSENMRTVYRRLMVLGLLSGCLVVFGLSAGTESAKAVAPCYSECEDFRSMCLDSCAFDGSCTDEGDATCNSCRAACETQYWNCWASAVSCEQSESYTPRCIVDYTLHCPIISGSPDCQDQDAHYGYTMRCDTLGPNHCVACPDHNWKCTSGSMQSCY